jgi:hypothetical protein
VSELEQIVRPSQDGSIRPAPQQAIYGPPVIPDGNVISWGSSGSNIFQVSAHLSQNINNPWPKDTETKRTFDVVRVKNPDDLSQHVDVEAMTAYEARNTIDKSRITLKFAKMDPTEGGVVEIISSDNVRKQPGT